jgi:hypothetical protein
MTQGSPDGFRGYLGLWGRIPLGFKNDARLLKLLDHPSNGQTSRIRESMGAAGRGIILDKTKRPQYIMTMADYSPTVRQNNLLSTPHVRIRQL